MMRQVQPGFIRTWLPGDSYCGWADCSGWPAQELRGLGASLPPWLPGDKVI